jgi:Zn-dependent peptidase ImmA (M78 family)/transcriptional regulator with XRE-family HTH domain
MPASKDELARRIKTAREAAGLTQAEIATEIGVSRSAVTEIESGRRGVSSLELERIAFLVGRDMKDFLADEFREEDVLNALFRAQPETIGSAAVLPRLRHCLELARALQNLERLADVERAALLGTTYAIVPPRTRWDANRQGERVAEAERQRLGLGKAQLGDITQLLDSQGIRTAFAEFPDDISGLTIATDAVSAFVAVNKTHHANRQRFSFAHEYCHVLLDRDLHGRVSRGSERDDLREVRANAFAAAVLMPEEGILDAVEQLGKGRPSRQAAAVFDEEEAVAVESRTEPGSQDIQYYDVIQLAARFVVSPSAMMYRLRNLKLVTEAELQRLRSLDDERRAADLEKLMGFPAKPSMPFDSEDGPHAVFMQRFVGLALEVFRREKITLAKLRELTHLVDLSAADLDTLLETSGLADAASSRHG